MKVELVIRDSDTPVCRMVDWKSVPQVGDRVVVPLSVNHGDGVRKVESTLWHEDGKVQVFLAGWMDGNCADMLLREGWSKCE